jgi:hypothetical protein
LHAFAPHPIRIPLVFPQAPEVYSNTAALSRLKQNPKVEFNSTHAHYCTYSTHCGPAGKEIRFSCKNLTNQILQNSRLNWITLEKCTVIAPSPTCRPSRLRCYPQTAYLDPDPCLFPKPHSVTPLSALATTSEPPQLSIPLIA